MRYKVEAPVDLDAYNVFLTNKDKIIIDTINKHYETMLVYEKIPVKAVTVVDKLNQLKENAQEMANKDQRMRMQNLTQSYDIADSAMYEDIKELRNLIGLNPDY